MGLRPNAFGRRSLLWAIVAVFLAEIGFCVFFVLGLCLVAPLAAMAFGVGGLYGVIGLWWGDVRASAVPDLS